MVRATKCAGTTGRSEPAPGMDAGFVYSEGLAAQGTFLPAQIQSISGLHPGGFILGVVFSWVDFLLAMNLLQHFSPFLHDFALRTLFILLPFSPGHGPGSMPPHLGLHLLVLGPVPLRDARSKPYSWLLHIQVSATGRHNHDSWVVIVGFDPLVLKQTASYWPFLFMPVSWVLINIRAVGLNFQAWTSHRTLCCWWRHCCTLRQFKRRML